MLIDMTTTLLPIRTLLSSVVTAVRLVRGFSIAVTSCPEATACISSAVFQLVRHCTCAQMLEATLMRLVQV